MDAAGKHGKAKERKEGSAAELSEKMQGDPVCLCVKRKIPTITEAVQEMTRPSSRYPRAVISPFFCDVPAFLPQASPTNLEMDVWMEEAVRAKHIAKTGAIS